MLNISVNKIEKYPFFSRVIANVLENLLPNALGEHWFTVLGGPDKMYPNFYMRHVRIRLKPDFFGTS